MPSGLSTERVRPSSGDVRLSVATGIVMVIVAPEVSPILPLGVPDVTAVLLTVMVAFAFALDGVTVTLLVE